MKNINILIKKELKNIFYSKTTFLILIFLCLIIGYSFYTAINLYSKSSVAALNDPLYASGFEPVLGIFRPCFGGFYIVFSFLLPFLFVTLITNEKKNNTMQLLYQLPVNPVNIILTKFYAGVILLIISLLITLPAVIFYIALNGHIYLPEIILLFSGYFLYGILILSISIFAGAVLNTTASSSILTLGIILISFFIEFGKENDISSVLIILNKWTLPEMLSYFEKGVFSLTAVTYFVLLSSLFLFIANIALIPKQKYKKIISSVSIISFIIVLIFTVNKININFDLTESSRNLFQKNINKNLKNIHNLKIDIYMQRTDSRFKDYDQSFLQKFLLINKNININFIKGKKLDQNYGKFVYNLNKKFEETYSNSEEEIIPIVFKLACIKLQKINEQKTYKGYPMVITARHQNLILIIYFIACLLIIFIIYLFRRLKI